MIRDLARDECVIGACREFNVRALHVFGSVAAGRSDARDMDLLVEFQREGYEGAFEQFMGFKERMEEILGRLVDLMTAKAFRNPIFREEVQRTKKLIYAA